MERRLSAIVAADLVGYSRMMRADEEGTLTALRMARSEIVDPTIARFGGRIVKVMGDGLLVEFGSAVDAVNAVVDTQRAMVHWNEDRPQDGRIVFRVGVNLGDVIIDDKDIQGDGVNVAARLEAISAPGGVCLSDAVHEQIRDRLDLECTDLGPQSLKNIDRPVRVWQWSDGAPMPGFPEDARPQLPDRPSIAVLPFDNMSGDPEQDYFADGISEDIITALSRNSELFVIARNSSFSYRGTSVDIRMVGRDLGVQFVLEGSVRRASNRVRITAQLIEAETGVHVWAENYDGSLEDVFELQDRITASVTGAVSSEIVSAGLRSVMGREPDDLRSWDRILKARWHVNRPSAEDNRLAQEICRTEIAINNSNPEPYYWLCWACGLELMWGFRGREPGEIIRDGIDAGQRAIELDPNADTAHAALGGLYWIAGNREAAEYEARTAMQLNPNSLVGPLVLGCALGYGDPKDADEALALFRMCQRIAPRDTLLHFALQNMAVTCFVSERYDEAIEHANHTIRLNPKNGTAHRAKAASLVMTGDLEAAKVAFEKAQQAQTINYPAYAESVKRIFKLEEVASRFIDALRKAGAPID